MSLVLGLERVCPRKVGPLASDFFLCPWPWLRTLCSRLHLCNLSSRRRGLIVCESLLCTAPYEIMYRYKFFWKKISLQNEFMQGTGSSSVFTFQDRQKSKYHNTILLTFMICSLKQLSAVSVNCRQSSAIIQ